MYLNLFGVTIKLRIVLITDSTKDFRDIFPPRMETLQDFISMLLILTENMKPPLFIRLGNFSMSVETPFKMHLSFLLHQVIAWIGFNFYLFPLFSSYENEDFPHKNYCISFLLKEKKRWKSNWRCWQGIFALAVKKKNTHGKKTSEFLNSKNKKKWLFQVLDTNKDTGI